MATQILITDAGRAALVAPGNGGTSAHQVVEIGLANAPFVADKGLTKLPNELKRITTFGGANIAPDTIHATLKDDTADQYSLYGFGLYLENGVLLAAYGQATPIMEKSPAALLLLSTDMQFATIDATQLVFGDASFLNPPATAERQGVVELATQIEVDAGTDAVRAITPATLKPKLDAKANLSGADFTGRVSTTDVVRLASAPGNAGASLGPGNGDSASQTANNVALRSWFGIGFGPNIDNMPVPRAEYSHWFDTRTGNTGFRGTLDVAGLISAQTPAAGDVSRKVPTTEWVVAAIASAAIGTIVFELRTSVRTGFLKLNGAVVKRADYPALWAYAQASGALVAESAWASNNWGSFSTGDGSTTFRLPEMRGEFIRCWADGRDDIDPKRSIGSFQDSQNRWHGHGASAAGVGDHAHSAWTDSQGWHGHHGWTGGVGDHQHVSPWGENPSYQPPWGTWGAANNVGSSSTDADNRWGLTSPAGSHNHEFNTEGAGTHGHNIGVGGSGAHSHAITVNGDGGNETRPRNIALLAMIRAY
ncbi:tail fiber protein [Burkholderia ubonensis]|uniref:tail fiber protein n=1 Tax=Burkholderia ubonensis TaxID=101571 RepID=UPI000F576D71|nr:tail fiber protein [Burkholderia ubonensis]RQP29566.1 phage tail protein [Burkholderia ubonensis]RQP32581.1 phage tail protein [Burkholderia ubonensis]RQP35185.1 phage tail protein [Burkholderia ubonensis]RQP50088.1 phage tail protein [Burkholderia ubonensis]RQP54161.1 phage tail protein [Burkholderia ubonensis]